MVDHVNPKIAHPRVFHTGEFFPSTSRKFAHSPHHEKLPQLNFYPPRPTKQQFSSYNPIKTAFLAVGIAPAPLF